MPLIDESKLNEMNNDRKILLGCLIIVAVLAVGIALVGWGYANDAMTLCQQACNATYGTMNYRYSLGNCGCATVNLSEIVP